MKSPFLIGLAGDIEASYAAGGTVDPVTQGIQLAEPAEMAIAYGFDGARAAPPGTVGTQRRVAPNGATASTTFKLEPKGAGAAYSASIKPIGHALRRAAGWTPAVTVTGGLEKWVYTPTPDPAAASSGYFDAYGYGEKYVLTGVLADWTVGADGAVIPIEEFAIQALLGAVDDAAVAPTLAYPFETILPPVSVGAGLFSFGNLTGAVLRKWQLKMNRSIVPLTNQNSGIGHAGFRPGRREFILDVTFETPAKVGAPYTGATTIDPKRLYEAGTEVAWAVNIGSVQYNRRKITGSKAQIKTAPKTSMEGNTVVTQMTCALNPSVLGANDEITDTWD